MGGEADLPELLLPFGGTVGALAAHDSPAAQAAALKLVLARLLPHARPVGRLCLDIALLVAGVHCRHHLHLLHLPQRHLCLRGRCTEHRAVCQKRTSSES